MEEGVVITDELNRVRIAHLPTPLEPWRRLSAQLGGPRLLAKRDDMTGLATGGNKARKLEFLVGEALAGRADVLLTGGAPQSNHARQTAAAAAKFGRRCILVLRGEDPGERTGNLLLDELLGAEIRWAGDRDLAKALEETAEEQWSVGGRPALIPYGGSNPIGASGYVAAMEELIEQLENMDETVDAIVFASSSGGTQAGLVVGARALNFGGRIVGISVDKPRDQLAASVAALATETAKLLGQRFGFQASEIEVNDDYVGGGYAVVGEAERDALRLVARAEGVILDPVYTGRAAAGLVDLIGRGYFGANETVLFWHTGGTAGLFGFAEAVVGREAG
jgi:D-cysteine desulfhydrase family pyridoxal phosphate-dependent enzyme